MTVSSVFSNYSTNSAAKPDVVPSKGGGLSSLGSTDFLKLMTAQMQQQDPTDPVDNKEMLAQMAQFSSLASTTEMGDTLKSIASKLDVLVSAQPATTKPIAS
jgi:flagellar basal-body rod modification protein FlgD